MFHLGAADPVQAEGLIFRSWGHRPQKKSMNNEGSLKGFHDLLDGRIPGPALQAGGLPVVPDPWGMPQAMELEPFRHLLHFYYVIKFDLIYNQ